MLLDMQQSTEITAKDIDQLSRCSREVISILTMNEEKFTENNTGYIFDLSKLGDQTKKELKDLRDSVAPMKVQRDLSDLLSKKDDAEHKRSETEKQTSKIVAVSPKFLNEYNTDFHKITAKPASLLKFLNAKKKYLRNSDNSTGIKLNLKKE